MVKIKAALAGLIAALVCGIFLVAGAITAPAQACCGNGWQFGHALDDTGANFAITTKGPPNGTIYTLSLGQWAMVTQVYVEAGYKINCPQAHRVYTTVGWNFVREDQGACYREVA